MDKFFQRVQNGVEVTIKEGYQFPHGSVYKGEVSVDGKFLLGVQTKTDSECRQRLCKSLEERVASYRKEANRLNKIKKLVEGEK